MIAFIDIHRDQFGVEASAALLERQSVVHQLPRLPRSEDTASFCRALRDEFLVEEVKRIQAENYSVYGVRKMHHAMTRAGWRIGPD